MKSLLTAALALSVSLPLAPAKAAEAIFAGGCFWCIEADFEKVPGVNDVVSGYSGGTNENPTYKNHVQFMHREVVKIDYDPEKVSYETLANIFFRTVNPMDGGGQFCDRGFSYSTAIYALDGEQLEIAKKAAEDAGKALNLPIATEIAMAAPFWPAEDYHQDYYKKNPVRYTYYRTACGRDKTVKKLWGDQAYQGVPGKGAGS